MSQETLCKCGERENHEVHYMVNGVVKRKDWHRFRPQEAPAPCVHGCVEVVEGMHVIGLDEDGKLCPGTKLCPDHGKAPAQGEGPGLAEAVEMFLAMGRSVDAKERSRAWVRLEEAFKEHKPAEAGSVCPNCDGEGGSYEELPYNDGQTTWFPCEACRAKPQQEGWLTRDQVSEAQHTGRAMVKAGYDTHLVPDKVFQALCRMALWAIDKEGR